MSVRSPLPSIYTNEVIRRHDRKRVATTCPLRSIGWRERVEERLHSAEDKDLSLVCHPCISVCLVVRPICLVKCECVHATMRACNLALWISLLVSCVGVRQSAPLIPIITGIATAAAGLFNIQIDTLHIARYLRDASNCRKNRASFVRDLLYTAFYRSGETHNVMVFNLGEEHRHRLHRVSFYGSVSHPDGTRFGVWVFESGVFENKGARGWHNWGMIGTFKKSTDGETIYFHKRFKAPPTPPPPIHQATTTIGSTVEATTTTTINVTNTEPSSNITSAAALTTLMSSSTTTNIPTTLVSSTSPTPLTTQVPTSTTTMTPTPPPPITTISTHNPKDILGDFMDYQSPLLSFDNSEAELMGNLLAGKGVDARNADDDKPNDNSSSREINIENNFTIKSNKSSKSKSRKSTRSTSSKRNS